MAISRAQLVKELEPGLNALFGLEYKNYANEHTQIFDSENSDRAFEEEVMLSGFSNAQVKPEGSSINYDSAQETFTARYTHETLALAFSITEEANIANNYDTAIYTGQVVEAVAAGGIEAAAAADTQVAGVFGGVFYTDPTTSKPTWSAYYPASTNASDLKATVYSDPMIVFEAQHDETGTAAMNHANLDFVGTSGSAINGQSSSEIDTSTANAGSSAGGNFKQLGISNDPDNQDTGAANANAYVTFSTGEHIHKLVTAV